MVHTNQIITEGIDRGNASSVKWQRGRGPRIIAKYLFVDLPIQSSSSDEITGRLSDEEENAVARIVHFFLQARYKDASAEAERCMNSLHPEIRSFALLAHAVNNVAMNNIEIAQNDFQTLHREAQFSENKCVAALNDIYRFVLFVFFQLGEQIAPITPESLSLCSEGSRLYALYAQSYALYLEHDYAQALGMAKAALAMAGNRHPIISIYLNLAASMAAVNLSYYEQADRFFLSAVQIAKPEGYIQPFIGHHGPLQGLVEKHLREQEPELYKLFSRNVVNFRRGWTKIHNPHSSDKVTNLLTPYEFALAMMAAKGKTNREIADYFCMSVNTVKARLSTIYRKLGITKRSDLKKHLNK
jgi:DNA-binding CsgD family transcriptional regulator